ncbi:MULTISPECIES: hypothetical protein [unclassified Coleofasciculus]|uniref:hypothetical protein n=1 Tax=unclassified Coleofasciculus TaxID=2692782 RepID=UPI0018822E40|nr:MULTISPECIES: hypothetical protein [unclassified Coleofasciculus]MBE9125860.1 hypothetical protein [Coleofasciculus sp. LEGE 07081]MBE9149179.1 hypothetical protein [Coleofasciculus sp. LEGE 07092]
MRRKTLVILGIGIAIVGLAPIAQAQSGRRSDSSDSSVTLSGESLRTVENRSLSNDYGAFFNGALEAADGDADSEPSPTNQSPSGFRINDQLRLVVGDTITTEDDLNLFTNPAELGDSQRVKLEVPIGQ